MAADLGSGPTRHFLGIRDCVSKAYNVDGIRGLYRGAGISFTGHIAYRSLYFGLYDSGSVLFFEDPKKAEVFKMWLFAQSVTTISGLLTYPIKFMRTRMMMDSGRTEKLYESAFDCFKKVIRDEGKLAFWKGASILYLTNIGGSFMLVFWSTYFTKP